MFVENITAVILAGGRAARMGGQDKGLIRISGRPIVDRVASQLSTQVTTVLINANRNIDQYQQLGHTVVTDRLENFQGPLAGMAAALNIIESDWLLTAPCDGPFLAKDYAHKMRHCAAENNVQLAVASDGKRLQPVYALINRRLVKSLEDFLQSGERKIDRWYAQHSYATVSFSDQAHMFTNVNTPEQLDEVELEIAISTGSD